MFTSRKLHRQRLAVGVVEVAAVLTLDPDLRQGQVFQRRKLTFISEQRLTLRFAQVG